MKKRTLFGDRFVGYTTKGLELDESILGFVVDKNNGVEGAPEVQDPVSEPGLIQTA